MLQPAANLNLYRFSSYRRNHVNGAIAVTRLTAAIDDACVRKHSFQITNNPFLIDKVRHDDAATCDILHLG